MSTQYNPADDHDFMPDEAYTDDDGFAAFEADFYNTDAVTAPREVRVTVPAQAAAATPSTPAASAAPATPAQATPAFNLYGSVPNSTLIAQCATLPRTDMGLGTRIATHYKDVLAWQKTGTGGSWFINQGTHWAEDPKGFAAKGFARTVIASISNEEALFAAATDPKVIKAQRALDQAELFKFPQADLDRLQSELNIATTVAAREHLMFGERCENGTVHITAALEAAQAHLAVGEGQFDTNPYLVNFQNGTFDLRTGTLSDHDPKQYITKVCAVDYVPEAVHPDLDRVLATMAKSDGGLPLFLQRYLGSAASGLNSAKSFTYIKGDADAGKSTLFEAFAQALGDLNGSGYGRIVSPSLFAISANDDGEKAQPKLHDLRGVRFILADEAEKGFMNRETLNKMSAGGRMNTRALHGAPVTWKAQSKIVFAGNDFMAIPDNDPGITRRLITVELTHKLAGDEVDVNLQDRITTTAALEAIMAWAIRGAMDWLADGGDRAALQTTDGMAEASTRYLAGNDPLADWWDAYVIEVDEADTFAAVDESGNTHKHYVPLTSTQWHALYIRHCNAHKVRNALTEKQFSARLTARGFKTSNPDKFIHEGSQMNHGKFRRGIRHRTQTVMSSFDRSDF